VALLAAVFGAFAGTMAGSSVEKVKVKVVYQATRTCSELWSRPATRKARWMRYPYADHSTCRLCAGAVPGAVQKGRPTMTGKPDNAPVRAFSNLARNQGKPASQPQRAHSAHEHLHLRGPWRGVHVADRVRPASGHGLLAPPAVLCRPPAEAGLVRGENGRWHVPLSEDAAERLALLRKTR
jgi:hypothetical protein